MLNCFNKNIIKVKCHETELPTEESSKVTEENRDLAGLGSRLFAKVVTTT